MKKRIDWDQYFMVQAALLASRSTCTRLSVGAVFATNGSSAPAITGRWLVMSTASTSVVTCAMVTVCGRSTRK